MIDDDNERPSGVDDLSAPRERVVRAVLDRIAAAPRVAPAERPPLIDLSAWAIPALAAAAVIMIAAAGALLAPPAPDAADGTVVEWLGVPRPVAEYLANGTLPPPEWLNAYGSRP